MRSTAEEYLSRRYPCLKDRMVLQAENKLKSYSLVDAKSVASAYRQITNSEEWINMPKAAKIRLLYASVIAVDNIISKL